MVPADLPQIAQQARGLAARATQPPRPRPRASRCVMGRRCERRGRAERSEDDPAAAAAALTWQDKLVDELETWCSWIHRP